MESTEAMICVVAMTMAAFLYAGYRHARRVAPTVRPLTYATLTTGPWRQLHAMTFAVTLHPFVGRAARRSLMVAEALSHAGANAEAAALRAAAARVLTQGDLDGARRLDARALGAFRDNALPAMITDPSGRARRGDPR